jgi:hypothetical protein
MVLGPIPGRMLPYPRVMTGVETLQAALSGRSIARFGDGEMRLTTDKGSAISQVRDLNLKAELIALLNGPTKSLVCIPRQECGPKADRWQNYARDPFVKLMKQKVYGSAFITRPDNEPEISTPQYWDDVRSLWRNRDVTLVVGTDYGSLNENFMRDARNLKVVFGPRRDAYMDLPRIEDEIGRPPVDAPVIMCLGAAATVLAERLAKKGCWALDLGHVGKFMPKEFR